MNLITLDFETYFDKKYSLKTHTTSEYIRDPRFQVLGFALKVNDGPVRWFEGDAALPHLVPRIRESFLLHHHAQFDGAILAWHYGAYPRMYLDTMAMARGLGYQRAGLRELAAACGLGDKPEITPTSSRAEIEARGTWDAKATHSLFKRFAKGYPKNELKLIDWTVRCFTQPLLMAEKAKLIETIETVRRENAARLEDLGLTKEELRSADTFARILQDYGVDPPTKISPTTGKETWAFAKSDPAFIELSESEEPTVQALVAARLGVKSTGDETRGERLLTLAAHGPLPVYLSYYAAHPGRWGGGDKTNFQNLRRGGKLRDAIHAPPGKVLVVGDFSQIEARITAWLAGQDDLVQQFREGKDIYNIFGSVLYGKSVTKETVTERFVAKTGVLGCGFGCGWQKFKAQVRAKGGIEIDDKLARQTVNTWRDVNNKIVELWDTLEGFLGRKCKHMMLESTGDTILLPNGMSLHYHALKKERYKQRDGQEKFGWRYNSRKGRIPIWGGGVTENVAQALARIIMAEKKLALLEEGYRIPTSTHDEIVACVDEDDGEVVKRVMETTMSMAHGWYADLPLAAEVNIGHSYGEAK